MYSKFEEINNLVLLLILAILLHGFPSTSESTYGLLIKIFFGPLLGVCSLWLVKCHMTMAMT